MRCDLLGQRQETVRAVIRLRFAEAEEMTSSVSQWRVKLLQVGRGVTERLPAFYTER